MKSKEVLGNFIVYCQNHPDERFWQALRNWSIFNFIIGFNNIPKEGIDTFYFEEKDK